MHWTLLSNEVKRKEEEQWRKLNSCLVVLDMIIISFSTFLCFAGRTFLITGVGWNLFFVICLKMSQFDGKKIQTTNHLVSPAQNYFHHRH